MIATFSVVGTVSAIVLKIIGVSTPGWFSLILGILVLMFLQTGTLIPMRLKLTGVMPSGSVTTTIAYQDFIEQVIETSAREYLKNEKRQ